LNWFCKHDAHAINVQSHLLRLEDDGEAKIVAADLSELYLKPAGTVAEQLASRAGCVATLLGASFVNYEKTEALSIARGNR
jgi:hypothetical protein